MLKLTHEVIRTMIAEAGVAVPDTSIVERLVRHFTEQLRYYYANEKLTDDELSAVGDKLWNETEDMRSTSPYDKLVYDAVWNGLVQHRLLDPLDDEPPLLSPAAGPVFIPVSATTVHVQIDAAADSTLPDVDQERTGLEEDPLQTVARLSGRGGPGRGQGRKPLETKKKYVRPHFEVTNDDELNQIMALTPAERSRCFFLGLEQFKQEQAEAAKRERQARRAQRFGRKKSIRPRR